MPRPFAKPLSLPALERRPCPPDALLAEVLAAIDRAPIRDEQIRQEGRLVFGDHDDRGDGTIRINTRLFRVAIGLHELTHRTHPDWPEEKVRRRSLRLLHMLDDDAIAALDARIVAAMRRATRSRAAR